MSFAPHLPRDVAGSGPFTGRSGFTLVELLVASAIAVSVIGALATIFAMFSRTASDSQAIVAMSSQLRFTANRLRQDLAGITAPLTPPLDADRGAGYFELIEGPNTDLVRVSGAAVVNIAVNDAILGDVDDILLFTTRSTGAPFHGKYQTVQIESPVAEVAWFCRPATLQPIAGLTLQNLYRRQLLVVSHIGAPPFSSSNNNAIAGSMPAIYNTYDLSLRTDAGLGMLVPNSLADLTRRENRFLPSARASPTGPVVIGTTPYASPATTASGVIFDAASNREGEDIVLGNVIGFDVRVFDADAIPRLSGATSIYPNEQGYPTLTVTGTSRGGFVDLGCLPTSGLTILTGSGSTKSGLSKTTATGTATYDTWSTHWESNGVDDDGVLGVDQATNGADDNANGLPDDPGEAEVPPPYARRIPAIEVRIRCYDPTSRQIRQTTVRQQFSN